MPTAIKRTLAELCRIYSPEAVRKIAHLMRKGDSHAIQFAAACALLIEGGKVIEPDDDARPN